MNLEFKPIADAHHVGDTARFVDERGFIRGADVEAHRIAALVDGGMGQDEVNGDYPNLTISQIDAAVRYASANPLSGRRFPTQTAKSVLRDGSGGGLVGAFATASEDEDSE